jgi:hypothetical protein
VGNQEGETAEVTERKRRSSLTPGNTMKDESEEKEIFGFKSKLVERGIDPISRTTEASRPHSDHDIAFIFS